MDFELMINSFPKLLNATLITLKLLSASLFFGLFIGLLFAILRMSKIPIINKFVYGYDIEFVEAKFPTDPGNNLRSDEEIYSQYIDYQFRPYEHIFATIGGRNDVHTTAGDEQSYRITTAYKLNKNSKIRTSYGTGFLFPALYEGHEYGWSNASSKDSVNAEKTTSFKKEARNSAGKFN